MCCTLTHIQSIVEATHAEAGAWLELYGTTSDGKVFRVLAVENTPDRFEEAVLDLERQAAEGLPPVASLTEYQIASLRDSQEIKLNQILAELEHSSSSLPSLAAPLAA